MNNARKFAIAAIAGAVVSSTVSANRRLIFRLLHTRKRRQQLKELDWWYDRQLESAEGYATHVAHVFTDEHQDVFLAMMDDSEQLDPTVVFPLKPFADSIYEFVRLHRTGEITREYGIRLYDLDVSRAYEQKEEAAELMAERDDVAERMRLARYPIDTLYKWMEVHP